MKTKLFLHMGPGFHSRVEENVFGTKYPDVLFWDQPSVTTYAELIESSENILIELHTLAQRKISLRAHSFGGQIAKELIARQPDKIDSVYMLNSSADPFECFLNLSSVSDAEKENIRNQSVQEKMNFIFKVASEPNFNDRYWFSKDKMKDYLNRAALYPQLNIESFSSIFSDFLAKKINNQEINWQGSVILYASKNDELIKKETDIQNWFKIFPRAQVKVMSNSGHFGLFEDLSLADQFFK